MTEPTQVCGGEIVRSTPDIAGYWSVSSGAPVSPAAHDVFLFHTRALAWGHMGAPTPVLHIGEIAESHSYTDEFGRAVLTRVAFEGGSNEARTRQLVGHKIHQVWALKDGWRGPGSLAPTRLAREFYLAAVQVLPGQCLAAAQPTPTADGGLHMEWTRGQYDYSAEITSDGQLILNAFAPNEKDDSEQVIDIPTPEDLVGFICRRV